MRRYFDRVMSELERTALMKRLKTMDVPALYGRLFELRARVEDWLSYVPQTFPHYTRHTIRHSQEIVEQMSLLLFMENDQHLPSVDLSAAEIYCLVAAAFLHDAGMVASDEEKLSILSSPEWHQWTTNGTGTRRWEEINLLRSSASDGPDGTRTHFLADLQTRFLLAEFIRKQHHVRSGMLVRHNSTMFELAGMGEPALARTIADICESHGLGWRDIDDPERYPYRRDLTGGPVNVRLMSILLRLGDLLDLSHDRACPLLLSAAAPVPSDSFAHWSQYQRIVHRATTAHVIEATAECKTRDEHRVLRDWFEWIASEAEHATPLLRASTRHNSWRPPVATTAGAIPSLQVRPERNATYVPVDWRFELDAEAVLERLISDAYEDSMDFLRELIQNAADATRCRIRTEEWMESDDRWPPSSTAAAYPINIALTSEAQYDEISGEEAVRTIVSVSDDGVGMDLDVIQRYLLQVGRSYYKSPEFKRQYGFVPTSRFGVGFLSVFGISDRVVVDTRSVRPEAAALRIELTGPRTYILVEASARQGPGTEIRVAIRDDVMFADVASRLNRWCRRLEFPVVLVDERTNEKAVFSHEQSEQFEGEADLPHERYDKYRIRALPIHGQQIRGEWYVGEARERDTGQWRWDVFRFQIEREAVSVNPLLSQLPSEPRTSTCLHGIALSARATDSEAVRLRIDIRKHQDELPVNLAREAFAEPITKVQDDPEIAAAIGAALETHFRETEDSWRYRASTLSWLTLPRSVVLTTPRSCRIFDSRGVPSEVSLNEVANADRWWFVSKVGAIDRTWDNDVEQLPAVPPAQSGDIVLLQNDSFWNSSVRHALFEERTVRQVVIDGGVCFSLIERSTPSRWGFTTAVLVDHITGSPSELFLGRVGIDTSDGWAFINVDNPAFKLLGSVIATPDPGTLLKVHTMSTGHQSEPFDRLVALALETGRFSEIEDGDIDMSRVQRIIRAIYDGAQSDGIYQPEPTFQWQGSWMSGIVPASD